MRVSQLRHDFDWSVVKVGKLHLTSVSMDPNSSYLSASRLIANMVHKMNAKGYGSISNLFVKMNLSYQYYVDILKCQVFAAYSSE